MNLMPCLFKLFHGLCEHLPGSPGNACKYVFEKGAAIKSDQIVAAVNSRPEGHIVSGQGIKGLVKNSWIKVWKVRTNQKGLVDWLCFRVKGLNKSIAHSLAEILSRLGNIDRCRAQPCLHLDVLIFRQKTDEDGIAAFLERFPDILDKALIQAEYPVLAQMCFQACFDPTLFRIANKQEYSPMTLAVSH